METQLLNDPGIFPDDNALMTTLGDSFEIFREMREIITNEPLGFAVEWRYYNDGKAWLCKVTYKKKTMFWLSVWDGFFRTGFYFAQRHCQGIADLDIDESIKTDFRNHKTIGKLFPLVMVINRREQLPDLLKIAGYRKSQK